MRQYSDISRQRLETCHEDLQLLFALVLQCWDNTILVGHRSKEEQVKAYTSGRSQVKWPDSKHNTYPSMAVDVSPWPIPKGWGAQTRDELEKFRYFAFYVCGVADALQQAGVIRHTVRWGGDWDGDNDVLDNKFEDLVHFELVEVKNGSY